MVNIEQISSEIHRAAKLYPIKRVDLFGSYAEKRNTPDSDVDLLVEFYAPHVSLILLNQLKYSLEEGLHTPVDVVHGPLSADSLIEIGRSIPLYGA